MNTLLQNGSVSDLTGASAKIARAALLAFIAMTASACAVRHDSLSPRVASAKHIRGNTISYHGQILHDSSQGPNPAAKLGWPLPYAEVTSLYGPRGWDFHDGVDLAAPDGTPVLAAHNGRVIYADNELSSYGKTVIIQGYDRLVTIYAHNSSLLVKPGQEVLQGQQIAEVGVEHLARTLDDIPHVGLEDLADVHVEYLSQLAQHGLPPVLVAARHRRRRPADGD